MGLFLEALDQPDEAGKMFTQALSYADCAEGCMGETEGTNIHPACRLRDVYAQRGELTKAEELYKMWHQIREDIQRREREKGESGVEPQQDYEEEAEASSARRESS